MLKDIEGVVMLSTDKAKIPKKIIEIASKLNIGIYVPKKDIPIKKKKRFYTDRKLKSILCNVHELDAYIAAYFALLDIKSILEKAKRVSKNDKEYIEILKISLKNRKIEPYSAKNLIKEKKSEVHEVKKKRKKHKALKRNGDIIDLKIENNQNSCEHYKKILTLQSKKYLKLLSDYDQISEILLDKIKGDHKVVPKISFLLKKNIKFNRLFVDVFSDEAKRYIIKNKPQVFLREEDVNKLSKLCREKYIVIRYKDLRNFVLIEDYKVYIEEERKVDISKIKKLIDSFRY